MQLFHKRAVWFVPAAVIMVLCLSLPTLWAQSLTSGAIAGSITDQTAALVPGATVTVTNIGTGDTHTVTTNAEGHFQIPLLVPADYRIKVEAKGFRIADQGPITVIVSQTSSVNVTLEVGTATQTVEVTANAQLIQTENPNTTTTVSTQLIDSLPNAGNDLTYVAQIAPGAIMNTTGGYGNMEFNGLPATSTNFTVDGMDANDPFLNLNNSGATNLQLGLNAVQEVSVNTLSFSVDQGRSGAAQVNYITKPGTNNWHGNAFETWNGSSMNAVDWFINASPGAPAVRTFSNVNQYGGSVGGPIIHNKLFVFGDVEGIQIVLPATKTENYPTQAYESLVATSIPTGGYDPSHGVTYAPPPNAGVASAAYQKELALYGNPSGGNPISTSDCPLGNNPNGSPAQLWSVLPHPKGSVVHGDGCRLTRTFGIANKTHDLFIKTRVDHDINQNNRVWYSFEWEKGVQATYTDAVNPVFDAYSTQPQSGASISYAHTFSPNMVNEFNPGYYWYSAIFEPNSFPKALAASPYEFTGGSFTGIYGAALDWPQGRNVLDWQLIDNLTWSRGNHTFKFGGNLRRSLVSDHDPGFETTPYLNMGDEAQYAYDILGTYAIHGYAPNLDEPIKIAALDMYAQDTWKWKSNVTFTYGLRATWNSDPKSSYSDFARYTGSFFTISHDVNQPLNSVINAKNSLIYPSTQLIAWQPRASVAWSVKPKTVVRLGGGAFSDIFPASVADSLLGNFPNKNLFYANWNGQPVTAYYAVPGSGNGIAGDPNNDGLSNITYANTQLNAGFKGGVLSCAAMNAPANCLPAAGYYAVPDGTMKYPLFYEWRATVEQEVGANLRLSVGYVGTHASHMPYTEQANGFQTVCQGCFAPYLYDPTFNGPDGRFGGVTQLLQGANSTYHALQTSIEKRMSHGLTVRGNYTWSHCIDTSSNEGAVTGGFDPTESQLSPNPGQLYSFKGNCDYDVRHEFNGSWVYQLPSPTHNRFLKQILGGWQYSGDIFLHTGFPFSVYSAGYGFTNPTTGVTNGVFQASGANGGTGFAPPTGASLYAKWQKSPTQSTPDEIQWLNPNAFESTVDPSTGACTAGQMYAGGSEVTYPSGPLQGQVITNDNPQTCQYGGSRNNVFSPGLIWTDMFIGKNFNITERVKLRIDGQFYNAINHMNPGFPGTSAGITQVPATLTDAYVITGAVNPPTGLLGSGLGGDNSVRMIAFHARLEF